MKSPEPDSIPPSRTRLGPSTPIWDEPVEGRSIWNALFLGAFFVACLALATAPGRTWVAGQPNQCFDAGVWRDQNLGSYIGRPGEFKGLFLGSSRVVRGVMPSAFERAMKRAGEPMATLNLGNPGMNFVEQAALLKRLIAWGLDGVEFVVFELNEMDPKLAPENRRSPRFVGWHTSKATCDILGILWNSERSLWGKLQASYEHVLEWSAQMGSSGQAQLYWNNHFGDDQPRRPGRVAREGGYNSYPEAKVIPQEGFEELMQPLDPREGRVEGLKPLHRRLLLEVDAELRSVGVLPIFLRMPGFRRKGPSLKALEAGVLPVSIDCYTDERTAPIFARANFHDKVHLNSTGARLFSRLLAGCVLDLYADGSVRAAQATH